MTESTATKTALESVPAKKIEQRGPFELFDDIYQEIASRAFAIFEGNGGNVGHELDHWLQAEAQLLHPVHLRIAETDNSVAVEAEVPGFGAKDLAIGLDGKRLTICGKKETSEEQKKGKAVYQEHCSNEIMRAIDLPADVDGSKATAKLKNGVLELELPKSAKPNSARVEVKVA